MTWVERPDGTGVWWTPDVWSGRHYWYGPFDRPCTGYGCECASAPSDESAAGHVSDGA